jgi:molybdopterin-guanine dinucleotide biosynthesis protein A
MMRNEPAPLLSVVIQAGGESRRMGRDKGLVMFLGQPLVARLVERLRPIASELLVTTNTPQDYEFLGLPLFSDPIQGVGALGGLYTALHSARLPLVAVVACDMPFASPALLIRLRDAQLNGNFDCAVPRSQGGLEPFHAVYAREPCLPHIQAAIEAGKRRADAWFHAVRVYLHAWEKVLETDPTGRVFLNVNTPQELQQAEHMARDGDIFEEG